MASTAMRALLQPAAIGVLLRQGWYVYNEAVKEGAGCLLVCSIGIVSGFTVASLASSGDRKQQNAAALVLFWLSCLLSGTLLVVCQVMEGTTSNVIVVLISSSLLGAALPYIIPKVLQNLEPEVWMPLLAAALLAETLCSAGERFFFLKGAVPTFLFWVGLHGCMTNTTHSIRDVLLALADFFDKSPRAAQRQNTSETGVADTQGASDPVTESMEQKRSTASSKESRSHKSSGGSRESKTYSRKHAQEQQSRKEAKQKMDFLRAELQGQGDRLDSLRSEFQESKLIKSKGKQLSVDAPAFVPSFGSVESTSELSQSSLRAEAAEYVPTGECSMIDGAGAIGLQQWPDDPNNEWNLEQSSNDFASDYPTWEQYDATSLNYDKQPVQRAKLKVTAKAFVPSCPLPTPSSETSWNADSYEYQSDNMASAYDAHSFHDYSADNACQFGLPSSTEGVPCH